MLRFELYSERTKRCRGSSVFLEKLMLALKWPVLRLGIRKSLPEFKEVEKSKMYMVEPFLNSSKLMELLVVVEWNPRNLFMRKKASSSRLGLERPSKSMPFKVHVILRTLLTFFFDFSSWLLIFATFFCFSRSSFNFSLILLRAAAVSSFSVEVCPDDAAAVVAVADAGAASSD